MAGKKIMSAGGIGVSKPFVAPEGDEIRPDRSDWTVGGVPIADLPPNIAAVIPYENTDQGLAEKAQRPTAFSQVTSDEFDKTIAARHDALADGMPSWAAPDPMRELADKHVGPGMSPKFLSPSKCAREGTRGFEVVKDESGNPVKLGNMLLGQMPVEKKEARNRHYQKVAADAQAQNKHEFQEQQAKMLRDAGVRPSSALSRPSDGDVGFQSVRGNQSD